MLSEKADGKLMKSKPMAPAVAGKHLVRLFRLAHLEIAVVLGGQVGGYHVAKWNRPDSRGAIIDGEFHFSHDDTCNLDDFWPALSAALTLWCKYL